MNNPLGLGRCVYRKVLQETPPPPTKKIVDSKSMSDKAAKLNAQCNCISVDKQKLDIEVHRLISDLDLAGSTATKIGSMLSSSGVFIDQAALDQMKALVKAVYKVCEMPLFQKLVLEQAPLIARHQQSTSGVFYGFDFHLGVNGPQLI